jgi:hypothetical protein
MGRSDSITRQFEIYSSERSYNTSSLIIVPNLMSVTMMMSWVYVPSLFTICRRAAEKLSYFLFGGLAVEFDWLSRPNGFEFEKSIP